jgi:excisionase family DNA binding protein
MARSMALRSRGSTTCWRLGTEADVRYRSLRRKTRWDLQTETPILGTMNALHSLADVQQILRVSRHTVSRLVRRGDLPVVEIGGRTLIESADLRAFLASRKRRRGQDDDGPVGAGPNVRTTSGETVAGHGSR